MKIRECLDKYIIFLCIWKINSALVTFMINYVNHTELCMSGLFLIYRTVPLVLVCLKCAKTNINKVQTLALYSVRYCRAPDKKG